jgi:hypothetical protein
MTPEAQKLAAADRDYRLALLQSTDTCKNKSVACAGGKYDPTPSPRRSEPPPRYNTLRINRHDGPEDGALPDRCLTLGLPEFGAPTGSFRRIVQTPGGIAIFYDVGQGQGWQRNIIMDGRPHLPASVRQWYGDSRGRWDGDTLVVDVSNFNGRTWLDMAANFVDENEHVVERFSLVDHDTIQYEATITDPTVFVRSVQMRFTLKRVPAEQQILEYSCLEGERSLQHYTDEDGGKKGREQ